MSDFDTLMADVGDAIADTFGESLTYTPLTGSPVSLTGCTFVEKIPRTAPATDGTVRSRTATATIDATELAAPAVHATITRNGEAWGIENVLPACGGTRWELRLIRPEPVEKSGERFRLART